MDKTLSKLLQSHVEAAVNAGLPGTAELIEHQEHRIKRLAEQTEALSKKLNKICGLILDVNEEEQGSDPQGYLWEEVMHLALDVLGRADS